jgi:serine/threonine protein kinase
MAKISVGSQFGKYEIVELLGEGSMGVVYKATDPHIRRPVAIKILKPGTAEALEIVDLSKEAQSLGRLNHPNILTVFEVSSFEGVPYMVAEFIKGRSLLQILNDARHNIPIQMVLFYLAQAALGLDYAHDYGVIHCDVKPANLIVDESNTLYVTDFGISRLENGSVVHAGSPLYMSPEQILQEPLDGRSDLFSLGIVAFELLTGNKPFQNENVDELLADILDGRRYTVAHFNPMLAKVDPIIDRALSLDANGRYASCSLFVSKLAEALEFQDTKITLERRTPVRIPRSTRTNHSIWRIPPSLFHKLSGVLLTLACTALIGAPLALLLAFTGILN